MGKELDWNVIAQPGFDDKRRQATGMTTGKQLFAKAFDQLQKSQDLAAQRASAEPILKSELIRHIINRLPIHVKQPIQNPTERVAGLNKSQDDDDGFYNSSPSMSQDAALKAQFEEVMETIPAGVQLIFKSWDKPMGQWVFKGSNGTEYAIYDKSVILYKGSSMENPGLFGLLYNTNLASILGD